VFIAVLVVLLALLGVLLFFFARTILGDDGAASRQVTVPNVVGRQASDAAAALVKAGLKPKILRVQSDQPVGQVVKQDPLPGRKIEKTSTVRLSVSSGPGLTTVPDVTGLPQKEAVKQIEKAGLFATIHQEHNAKVASGRVIRTDPTALNQVQRGSRVDVYVSSGPELVEVPNVVGDDRADARGTLEDAGLKVTIHEQDSSQPKDEVILEDPGAGSRVPRGTRTTITVSRGPQKIDVPDVSGQSRADAINTLRSAGFSVNVSEEVGTASDQGKVIRQSPGGGAKRDKGSTVSIVVGKQCDSSGGGTPGGGTPGGGGSSNLPPCQ
jgi:serine/threonine-protein kinase